MAARVSGVDPTLNVNPLMNAQFLTNPHKEFYIPWNWHMARGHTGNAGGNLHI